MSLFVKFVKKKSLYAGITIIRPGCIEAGYAMAVT